MYIAYYLPGGSGPHVLSRPDALGGESTFTARGGSIVGRLLGSHRSQCCGIRNSCVGWRSLCGSHPDMGLHVCTVAAVSLWLRGAGSGYRVLALGQTQARLLARSRALLTAI